MTQCQVQMVCVFCECVGAGAMITYRTLSPSLLFTNLLLKGIFPLDKQV